MADRPEKSAKIMNFWPERTSEGSFVSESSLFSPAQSQPRRSPSVVGSITSSATSTKTSKSTAHRYQLLTERLKTIEEQLHLTQTKNAADIENYEKQLLESQHDFDATPKRLEAKAARLRSFQWLLSYNPFP